MDVTDTSSYTYGDNGIFPVELCVADDDGDTTCAIAPVTVLNVAPQGQISVTSDLGPLCLFPGEEIIIVGEPVDFLGTATDPGSDDLTFTWDFGDGGSAGPTTYFNDRLGPDPFPSPGPTFPTGASDPVSHTYAAPGAYDVTLTVVDDDSGTDSVDTTVRVLGPQDLKRDAACELIEAEELDSGDPDLRDAIGFIYLSLGDNVNASLWAGMGGSEVVWGDPLHIDECHGGYKGEDVFQYEEEAADKLIAYLENDANAGTGVAELLPHVFWKLYAADRILAAVAIQDAIDAGGNPTDIQVALDLLAQADAIWEANFPDDLEEIADTVYDLLEASWEKAVGSYCPFSVASTGDTSMTAAAALALGIPVAFGGAVWAYRRIGFARKR